MSQELPSPEELRDLMRENPELAGRLLRQIGKEADKVERSYIRALFPKQKAFFLDRSKKKAAVCSRRAGKTEGVAAWLLEGGEEDPGGLSVYIALSRNNCRMILWRTMIDLNRRHRIGLQFREIDNQLNVIMPNGHRIWLAGCKDSAEIEKFRGLKLKRAAIDEGASYGPYLKALVEDVLEPALFDLDGELAIIGTPGAVPAGYFFEIATGEGRGPSAAAAWSCHHWTILDNPHVQLNKLPEEFRAGELQASELDGYVNARSVAYLQAKLEANNWTEDNPTFRREWKGEWVKDMGALVYPFDPIKNVYYHSQTEQEEPGWVYHMGIDVGFVDSSAFVVGGYRKGNPNMVIVYAEKIEGLIPSQMAVHIERLKQRYNVRRIVIDTGGLGKGYAEEANQRYGLAMEVAEKTKKRGFIEVVQGELLAGNIKIDPRNAACLIQEMVNLTWNEDKSEPDSRFEQHASDGFIYLVRSMLPYYRPELATEQLTPAEVTNRKMAEYRSKLSKQIKKRNEKVARRTIRRLFAR